MIDWICLFRLDFDRADATSYANIPRRRTTRTDVVELPLLYCATKDSVVVLTDQSLFFFSDQWWVYWISTKEQRLAIKILSQSGVISFLFIHIRMQLFILYRLLLFFVNVQFYRFGFSVFDLYLLIKEMLAFHCLMRLWCLVLEFRFYFRIKSDEQIDTQDVSLRWSTTVRDVRLEHGHGHDQCSRSNEPWWNDRLDLENLSWRVFPSQRDSKRQARIHPPPSHI